MAHPMVIALRIPGRATSPQGMRRDLAEPSARSASQRGLSGMKNMTTKEHVGITHSSLGSPLSDIEFRKRIMEGKASEKEWNKLDPQDRMNVLFNIHYAKQAHVSPWSLPVIKENDLFVARNIPYILTGDDELFVPQTL